MKSFRKRIVIFGAGEYGKCFYDAMQEKYTIEFFVDSNKKLWGTEYRGVPVRSIHEIENISSDTEIVIATRKHRDEIKESLNKKNIYYSNMDKFLIDDQLNNVAKPRIILLNTHDGKNVGDYLINMAERYFLQKFCKIETVAEIPAGIIHEESDYLKKHINRDDILLVSGGGYLGSLWLSYGENNVRKILCDFPENRIIILPQTMYFEFSPEGTRQKDLSTAVYNAHRRLTICLRDRTSYNLANIILKKGIKISYTPDIALLLNKNNDFCQREGILTCFRDDKEKVIGNDIQGKIVEYCLKNEKQLSSMTMIAKDISYYEQQAEAVTARLEMVKRSQVVLTDRLHCMIMCAITGTPCIAFDNLSKKISGVYDWVKNNRYIVMTEENDDWISKIRAFTAQKETFVYRHEIIDETFRRLAKHIIDAVEMET